MLALLKKKKLKEDKAANIFVNSILQMVNDGFPEVSALINEAPEFITPPNIGPADSDKFLLIVIAGNMKSLPEHFDSYRSLRMADLIIRKFSHALGIDADILHSSISKLQAYFTKINHPSKNTRLAMARAVFFKYELTSLQEEYFVKMESPNPIFLKRLNDTIENFIWDWEEFLSQFRLAE